VAVLFLLAACGPDGAARVSGAQETSASASTDASVAPPPLVSWYHEVPVGSPGGFVPNQVVGTHLQVPCGGYMCLQPGLQLTATALGRSPATSGDQVVRFRAQIYALDALGGWSLQSEDEQQVSIPAGAQVGYTTHLDLLPNTGGGKHVTFIVSWGDDLGRALGARVVAMDESSDYICLTKHTLYCSVHDGFVSVTEPN